MGMVGIGRRILRDFLFHANMAEEEVKSVIEGVIEVVTEVVEAIVEFLRFIARALGPPV